MFSSSLRASFVAPVASAVAVSAAPGLTVKTSTSSGNVDGLVNLSGTLAVSRILDKWATFTNCTATQQADLEICSRRCSDLRHQRPRVRFGYFERHDPIH